MAAKVQPRFTFFSAGQVRLHAAVWDGPELAPPLLLQHGLWDSWDSFAGVAPLLARRRTVVAPDLRGHGGSDWPASGYALDNYADDLAGIIAQLKVPKVDLLGHSLGGAAAIVLAARRPDALRCLILEDPPLPPATAAPALTTWFQTLLDLKRLPVERISAELAPLHFGLDPEFTERSARSLIATADGPFQTLIDEQSLIAPWPELLGAITVPTLFLSPDPDWGGPVEQSKAVVERSLSGVRFVAVEYAGHHIHAYEPDEFVRQVDDFLLATE